MARIRSIKPEFPQSETVGRLSRDARLLFVQLWTVVDDAGRARAASRMLASLLFPYDDDAPALIEGWLSELEGQGCIRRYSVGGTSYLDIPKWLEHQRIDRPSESKHPPFDEASTNAREEDTKPRASRDSPSLSSSPSSVALPERKKVVVPREARLAVRAHRLPDDFEPDREYAERRGVVGPWLEREVEKFRNFWRAKGGSGGAKLDWDATWQNWIIRAAEDGCPKDLLGAVSATGPPSGGELDPVVIELRRREAQRAHH